MKLVLLGLASLMCVSVAQAQMNPADQASHARRESEIKMHEKQLKELNGKIARLKERHAKETSAAHVRGAEGEQKQIAAAA